MFIASLWASIVAWFTPTILFCVTNIIIATIYIVSNNNNYEHNDHAHSDSISRITRESSFLSRTRSVNLSSYIPTTTIVTSEPQHNYEYQSDPPSYTSSSRLAQSIHQSPSYVAPLELSNDYKTSSFECEQLPLRELTRTPSIPERVKSIKLSSSYTEPEHITNSSSRQLDRVPSFFDRVKSFKISSPFTYETPSTQTEHHVIRNKSENTTSVIKKKGLVSDMKKSRSEMRWQVMMLRKHYTQIHVLI
ncbi:BEACH domain-containing protein LvsA-like protein [Tanacetum coccineum]